MNACVSDKMVAGPRILFVFYEDACSLLRSLSKAEYGAQRIRNNRIRPGAVPTTVLWGRRRDESVKRRIRSAGTVWGQIQARLD